MQTPSRYPFLPPYFSFRLYSPVLRIVYLSSLLLGVAVGAVLSTSSWGRTAVAVFAIASPITVVLLHGAVYFAKGTSGIPEPSAAIGLAMHVGGALTLLYTFTGFAVTGIGAAWLIGALPAGAHPFLIVGAALTPIVALWLVPYSLELMWK